MSLLPPFKELLESHGFADSLALLTWVLALHDLAEILHGTLTRNVHGQLGERPKLVPQRAAVGFTVDVEALARASEVDA